MSKKQDNLDNFFQKRSEGNYAFREEDWANMEAKLDADMPVAAGFVFGKYLWMALGALITSLFFLTYMQFSNVDNTNPVESGSILTTNIDKPTSENTDLEENALINETDLDDADKNIAIENKSIISSSVSGSKSYGTRSKNDVSVVKNDSFLTTSDSGLLKDEIIEVVEQEDVFNAFVPKSDKESIPRFGENSEIVPAETVKANYLFSRITNPSIELAKYKINSELKLKKFYALSITGGLDISSTSASSWGKPVLRFGFGAEYFITDKWSIGIGANLSQKKYQAKGTEYSPPKGFWTNGVVPDSTNAVCQVLDVPITVSYFQPLTNKSNLMISGGVSSWFMLKEDYLYNYKSNDPSLVSGWSGENENRYWLSVLNLSISYEYMLSHKWSVAVGPYFNIPLSGVGHGNVELQSFGLKGALRLNKFKL